MARRRKRKFNPTRLETGLLMGASVLVGSIGGFWLASWGCGRILGDLEKQGYLNLPRGS